MRAPVLSMAVMRMGHSPNREDGIMSSIEVRYKRSFMARPYASTMSFVSAGKRSKEPATIEALETVGRHNAGKAKHGTPFSASGSPNPKAGGLGVAPVIVTADDVTFLRLPEVKAITGLSKTSLYALIREQSFPSPVPIGPRAVAWVRSEVNQWAVARVAAARSASWATARKQPRSVSPHLRAELIKRA